MCPTKTPIRVGVLYEETQMTDLAGLDLLGNLTPQTINLIATMNPQFASMVPYAIPMDFLYISSSMDSAHVTPDMYVRPTHTYATAPRDLDILLLGGPNPATVKEESLSFLKEATCTNYDVGIDMFIEYTYQNFDKKMVEFGCVGLDFDYEGRSEFYKGKLPDMTMS
ncbi:unnamed protein product [Alternaria alternata]